MQNENNNAPNPAYRDSFREVQGKTKRRNPNPIKIMVNVNKYPYFWVKSYLVWRLKIVNATRAVIVIVIA